MPAEQQQSLGEQVIAWIEAHCKAPEGALVGQPLELMGWQKNFITAVYDNPRAVTRRAILSVPRKNGKTTIAASLLLAHLAGPAAVANSQLYSTAQSRDQAGLLYSLASKMVKMSPKLSAAIVCRDGAKALHCPGKGTVYRALSAEASTAYGSSSAFCCHDELGLVRGPRSELFEALESGTGAQLSPLSIVISTQAPTDNDLLSILIDDALANHDPHTVCVLHTAPVDVDPFDITTITMANPAIGIFQNPQELLQMADAARRMPSREAAYRRNCLNQRIEASSPFIMPAQWNACAGAPMDLRGRDVFCGLDLSAVSDLTALVIVGCDVVTGIWHCQSTFWLPSEGLFDKARADRIPYDLWESQGYLETTPGPVVSYQYVAQHLKRVFDEYRVIKIAYDRWHIQYLTPFLLDAGFSERLIKEKFCGFGQGFKDMSPALRDLESIILEKKLRHGGHPVLQMCVSNAVIERDSAGNRKLSKRRSTGRIDGAVCLAMALGVAPQRVVPQFDVEAMIG